MAELNLKYAPVPENAPLFAQDMVMAAAEISGVDLDYSVESLQAVDDIIGGMRADGVAVASMGETLFGFGCYVGEVFVRTAGGRWVTPSSTIARQVTGFPLAVELRDGDLVNPIGKTFKRLQNGNEDNLPYFYAVFTKEAGRPVAAGAVAKAKQTPWWMFWKK